MNNYLGKFREINFSLFKKLNAWYFNKKLLLNKT